MTTFMKYLFQTNDNFSYWVPRVILGCVILPHGAQKLFGWFGGFGFTNTMTYFTPNSWLALDNRVFDYHGRVIGFTRIDRRLFYSVICIGINLYNGGGYYNRTHTQWFFHELVWQTSRRRF